LQKVTLSLALLLAGALTLGPHQVALANPSGSGWLQTTANELITAVNGLRIANGLPPYTANLMLMQVAHRPGLTQRILDSGYPLAGDLSQGGFRAENITAGNKTAAQAVQEWTGDALLFAGMLTWIGSRRTA
jgi:uncharacterized protein YkwD